MSYPAKVKLTILQGSTFSYVLRWGEGTAYKAITGATKAAPVVLTVASHGLPDAWPVVISDVLGMTQLNAPVPADGEDYVAADYVMATSVTSGTLSIQSIDSKSYGTYTANTGVIRFATPVSLSGYTARMHVRRQVETTGTPLITLTTANGGIALDNTAKTITLTISATDTALLDFTKGFYDLEMVSGSGVVTRLIEGTVTLSKEVTR